MLVRSTARRHLDILTPIHAEASSACSVMRTGVGKATLGAGVERVAVQIAGGHGRRTAPVALARCRAPRLNRFVLNTKFVVRGTPQAHDAASPARRSKYRTPQGGDGAHVGRAAVAKLHVFRTRGLDAVGEAPRCGELCPEKTTERLRLSWVVRAVLVAKFGFPWAAFSFWVPG